MGDSYTSAPGLSPYEGPSECARSERNYPHLTAAALGLTLTDISCAGASRVDFTTAQYAAAPPQFEALSGATEVVSVSMGGNDNNIYGRIVLDCVAVDESDSANKGAPCKKRYGKEEALALSSDVAPYIEALAQIRTRAPHAKVFVVGYPAIASVHGPGCFDSIHLTSADFHWAALVEGKLNKMLQKTAKKEHYTYVDTASVGHDACEALGVRWIEPLVGSATGISLHPNQLGEEADARTLEEAMRAAGV